MLAEYFLIALFFFYFLVHAILYFGYTRSLNLKQSSSGQLPFVSVIVAAKNEEDNIIRCIDSLSKLNYPDDILEIILVDDRSDDRTLELMRSGTAGNPVFKVIQSRQRNTNNLKGKANAIDTAIGICRGGIILSTDADCAVPPEWISTTVSYYEDNTAMVCGFTAVEDCGLFSRLQNIDWMYLLTLAASSAGLNKILSCLGNNLSFSKKSYLKIGGYGSIDFSVTEDLALMRKIDSLKEYEIKFPVNKDCLVSTQPCRNIKELFSQKRRWFKGGIGINFLGYILGFELYFANLILVFGLLFVDLKLYLILILIKTISETFLISETLRRFDMKKLYLYYPLFSIYFAFYGLTLPFSFLFGKKIRWKGQKF